jgi:hypothetical protein
MKMNYQNYNPKALNINALEGKTSKVTLGFKCEPQMKIRLAAEAEKLRLTLSSYSSTLIEDAEKIVEIKTKQIIKKFTNEIRDQKKLINFYESEKLKMFFNDLQNQNIKYINSEGKSVELTIKSIRDVYTVLINSFKTAKK